jgi:hypothetical protein
MRSRLWASLASRPQPSQIDIPEPSAKREWHGPRFSRKRGGAGSGDRASGARPGSLVNRADRSRLAAVLSCGHILGYLVTVFISASSNSNPSSISLCRKRTRDHQRITPFVIRLPESANSHKPSVPRADRLLCERIRAELELHKLSLRSLAAFHVPCRFRRVVRPGTPAFPSGLRVVDPVIYPAS